MFKTVGETSEGAVCKFRSNTALASQLAAGHYSTAAACVLYCKPALALACWPSPVSCLFARKTTAAKTENQIAFIRKMNFHPTVPNATNIVPVRARILGTQQPPPQQLQPQQHRRPSAPPPPRRTAIATAPLVLSPDSNCLSVQQMQELKAKWPHARDFEQDGMLEQIKITAEKEEGLITKALDLLWELATLDVTVSVSSTEKALAAHLHVLKKQDRAGELVKNWVVRCIGEAESQWVFEAIGHIKQLILLIPQQPPNPRLQISRRNFIRSENMLCGLLTTSVKNYLDGMNTANNSRHSHEEQLRVRLDALEFVLQEGQLGLTQDMVDVLWESLVCRVSDAQIGFSTFASLIDSSHIDPDCQESFFKNNVFALEPSTLTRAAIECVESAVKKLQHEPQSVMAMMAQKYLCRIILTATEDVSLAAVKIFRNCFAITGADLLRREQEDAICGSEQTNPEQEQQQNRINMLTEELNSMRENMIGFEMQQKRELGKLKTELATAEQLLENERFRIRNAQVQFVLMKRSDVLSVLDPKLAEIENVAQSARSFYDRYPGVPQFRFHSENCELVERQAREVRVAQEQAFETALTRLRAGDRLEDMEVTLEPMAMPQTPRLTDELLQCMYNLLGDTQSSDVSGCHKEGSDEGLSVAPDVSASGSSESTNPHQQNETNASANHSESTSNGDAVEHKPDRTQTLREMVEGHISALTNDEFKKGVNLLRKETPLIAVGTIDMVAERVAQVVSKQRQQKKSGVTSASSGNAADANGVNSSRISYRVAESNKTEKDV